MSIKNTLNVVAIIAEKTFILMLKIMYIIFAASIQIAMIGTMTFFFWEGLHSSQGFCGKM